MEKLREVVDKYSNQPLRSESKITDYYWVFKAITSRLLNQGDLSIY